MQILTFAPCQHVRFGSKADICAATSHVRFTPNSDRKSGFPHKVMSALPPKADMCSAVAHVRFGPKADMYATEILGLLHPQPYASRRGASPSGRGFKSVDCSSWRRCASAPSAHLYVNHTIWKSR